MSQQSVTPQGYPISFNAVYTAKMSRLTTLLRAFMCIPQIIVLYILSIAACVVSFIAWWVILFTGNYPKGMWDFMAGYMRWSTRVSGYAMLMTDKYPPFSTNP
jgi:hypothetical protein